MDTLPINALLFLLNNLHTELEAEVTILFFYDDDIRDFCLIRDIAFDDIIQL
jgi:hypothetical protein